MSQVLEYGCTVCIWQWRWHVTCLRCVAWRIEWWPVLLSILKVEGTETGRSESECLVSTARRGPRGGGLLTLLLTSCPAPSHACTTIRYCPRALQLTGTASLPGPTYSCPVWFRHQPFHFHPKSSAPSGASHGPVTTALSALLCRPLLRRWTELLRSHWPGVPGSATSFYCPASPQPDSAVCTCSRWVVWPSWWLLLICPGDAQVL